MNRIIVLASLYTASIWFGLVATGTAIAAADPYKFEMIVFEWPARAAERPAPPPGVTPPQTATLPERHVLGRLEAIASANKSLGPVAYTLGRKGMIVHKHLAWVEVPRGLDADAWYQVGDDRVGGQVRVTRGRYLHLDADLSLRDGPGGIPYDAHFERRMRSDELHYLDSPHLGILIQATRIEPTVSPAADDGASGEPKPAQPATIPPAS
ncbi:MAG: hypothetical protein H6955_19235 [Chromatiaceae bacterium]|nr:hypothetical protein [Chromatiaceae bacterium]